MFDVITFGSATKDIFLRIKENVVVEDKKFATGKGVCFSMGSKIDAEEIYFTTGGGGTNTAATFSKQGYAVAYCGKIGKDEEGELILKDLKKRGVDTRFVSFTKERKTNYSVVIDDFDIDRTIFVYHGASDLHTEEDIYFSELRASWFYLAPFSSLASPLFYRLIEFAKEKNIKVMANPSKAQLKDEKIKEALKNVDILLLNMEEASILTGIEYEKTDEIIEEATKYAKETVLITQGVDGVIAYSNDLFYRAKPKFPDAVDKTGAGDSFGSGFLSEFMRSGSVKKAIQLGIANSTSCLQIQGAKNGLLGKDEKFEENPILIGHDHTMLKW
jgi:sugar/nucleoside kinase (ribokinase family)